MAKKLRKGDIIDFTERKRIDPTKSLLKCPICGMIGEKHRGAAGDMYIHKYKVMDAGGVLSKEIIASCIVPKEIRKPKPKCVLCEKVIKEKQYATLEDETHAHLSCLLDSLPKNVKSSKEEDPAQRAAILKEAISVLITKEEPTAVVEEKQY